MGLMNSFDWEVGRRRRYADAGFPALVRKLSFLNTSNTADALHTLSQALYGSLDATHHFTIYDGSWPVAASQEVWARYSLFSSSRMRYYSSHNQLVYHSYEQLLRQEESPTFGTDVQLEFMFSHIHTWRIWYLDYTHFRNLADSIWVKQNAMSRLSPVLGTYSPLQRLNVDGILNTRNLDLSLDDSIANFPGAFPELTTLTIKTFPRRIINQQPSPLQQIHLKQITLTVSSWKSFFSRARNLKPQPGIVRYLLAPLHWFLTPPEFPWPFLDLNEDIPAFSLSP
ncbi:hypothetical protein P885DRAFT_71419 [Corynascus similis CBS 632.67]